MLYCSGASFSPFSSKKLNRFTNNSDSQHPRLTALPFSLRFVMIFSLMFHYLNSIRKRVFPLSILIHPFAIKECCIYETFLISQAGLELPSDTTGQLDILRHDGDTLSVDSTQVTIFKETNQVIFGSFLQCQNRRSLPRILFPRQSRLYFTN